MKTMLSKGFRSLITPPDGQIAALDGARTIAILLVVALHSQIAISANNQVDSLFAKIPPFSGGWIGVPLFFVLSGYFIGGQLWKEFLKDGKVNPIKFILRRGFRIWPLYYFTIICVYIIYPEHCRDIWTNIFFLANYFGDHGPIRGAWSLSTEEQFYIFIPTFILIMTKFFKIDSLKKFRYILIALFLVPMITRFFTWQSINGFTGFDVNQMMNYIYRPFHTHFDELIVGLMLSNIRADKTFIIPKLLKMPVVLLTIISLIAIGLRSIDKVIFTYSALGLFFGGFVYYLINSNDYFTNFLSNKIFYWSARVSYGVYIIHHVVVWMLEDLGWFKQVFINNEVHLLTTFFLLFGISSFLSSITYIIIEHPALELRSKILRA